MKSPQSDCDYSPERQCAISSSPLCCVIIFLSAFAGTVCHFIGQLSFSFFIRICFLFFSFLCVVVVRNCCIASRRRSRPSECQLDCVKQAPCDSLFFFFLCLCLFIYSSHFWLFLWAPLADFKSGALLGIDVWATRTKNGRELKDEFEIKVFHLAIRKVTRGNRKKLV